MHPSSARPEQLPTGVAFWLLGEASILTCTHRCSPPHVHVDTWQTRGLERIQDRQRPIWRNAEEEQGVTSGDGQEFLASGGGEGFGASIG